MKVGKQTLTAYLSKLMYPHSSFTASYEWPLMNRVGDNMYPLCYHSVAVVVEKPR